MSANAAACFHTSALHPAQYSWPGKHDKGLCLLPGLRFPGVLRPLFQADQHLRTFFKTSLTIFPCCGIVIKSTTWARSSAGSASVSLLCPTELWAFKWGVCRLVAQPSHAPKYGPIAQLGERSVRIREVKGSNPSRSTRRSKSEPTTKGKKSTILRWKVLCGWQRICSSNKALSVLGGW